MKPLEIKGARTRLGYSQKFMANQLGVSEATYHKKERGIVRFTDSEKVELARILELDLAKFNDFLFDGMLPAGTIVEVQGA